MERLRRRAPELGAEVPAIGFKFLDRGGGSAYPYVEVLENAVIDEVDFDVLVAAALAGGNVDLPQKVQFGAAFLDSLEAGRFRLCGIAG
jgi:hypothetical protein